MLLEVIIKIALPLTNEQNKTQESKMSALKERERNCEGKKDSVSAFYLKIMCQRAT